MAGPKTAGQPLILVVDDSADMRGLLADVLRPAGYEVVGAPSAPRALSYMADRLPDLVITDLLMPGVSGFSLRSAMLKRPELSSIPVIILSGYWQRPRETLEAAAILGKPLNIDHLLECVGRLLDARAIQPGRPAPPPGPRPTAHLAEAAIRSRPMRAEARTPDAREDELGRYVELS